MEKILTNEEKAEEICKRHIFDSNHFDCCMEMAEWKEQEMIKKACEWLKDTLMSDEGGFPITSNGVKEFIKDFKQAMEE